MVDYEWKDMADMYLDELHSNIDLQKKSISLEHQFVDSLSSWELVMAHVDQDLGLKDPVLIKLSGKVCRFIHRLKKLCERGLLQEMVFVKDAHKYPWKVVVKSEKPLHVDQLRSVHRIVVLLVKAIKQTGLKGRDDVENYFLKVYHGLLVYEKVFRDLWRKERTL